MPEKKIDVAYSRNFGFWSEPEQGRIQDSAVSIGGVGGDGYQLGYKLAMMGVGEIRVADPETFERENSNRVFGATKHHIDMNKAEAFKADVDALDHGTKVTVFTDGVTTENVDEFIDGVDLIIDETELRYLHIGTMLARRALEKGIPELMVMNVGFAGVATSFKPDPRAKGFQEMMGVPRNMPLADVAEMSLDYTRALPYIPIYGDYEAFKSVIGGASLPSVSPGVDIASGIGTTETLLHLVSGMNNRRAQPTWFPRVRYMDALRNESKIIRHPRLSFITGAGQMALRSKLGVNPKVSYSNDDIERRRANT